MVSFFPWEWEEAKFFEMLPEGGGCWFWNFEGDVQLAGGGWSFSFTFFSELWDLLWNRQNHFCLFVYT